MRTRQTRRLAIGTVIPGRELVTISGTTIPVPDPRRLVHVEFRRFAGCPVCNLHLRSVVRRHGELLAAGIREVVVFHSSAEELLRHAADLPFAVVADPDKRLYAEFGVESARRALLDPRAWWPILGAILLGVWAILRYGRPVPSVNPRGGRFGLPADFLIGSDGRVLALRYGAHAYDQWSADEVLALASSAARTAGETRSDAGAGPGRATMGDAEGARPHARALLYSSLATLGVFAAHHAYGAVRYATPWRHHAAAVALVVGGAFAAASAVHRRRPDAPAGRLSGWMLVVLAVALVLGIGLFEGLYNHVAKDALFLLGAPRRVLLTLFPPPRYEIPNDAAFEISGVLQVFPAAFAARAAVRLARSLRAGARRAVAPGREAAAGVS